MLEMGPSGLLGSVGWFLLPCEMEALVYFKPPPSSNEAKTLGYYFSSQLSHQNLAKYPFYPPIPCILRLVSNLQMVSLTPPKSIFSTK